MAKRKKKYSIPPPWFVRTFAVLLLLIDLTILAILAVNWATLEWTGYALFGGVLVTMYFPIMALKTGDPEWVLLDLITPGI